MEDATLITMGCDYSASAINFGVVKHDAVVVASKFKLPAKLDKEWLDRFTDYVNNTTYAYGIENVYVEAPWSREIPGVRSDTGNKMARTAAIIETVCAHIDVPYTAVYPQTWRSVVYGKGKGMPKAAVAKQMALDYVLYTYGHETKDHNEAEAICIATYGRLVQSVLAK